MKIHAQIRDYGHMLSIWCRRGPFRMGAQLRRNWRTGRVSAFRRRRTLQALRTWAAASREPRDRLTMIRRRRGQ